MFILNLLINLINLIIATLGNRAYSMSFRVDFIFIYTSEYIFIYTSEFIIISSGHSDSYKYKLQDDRRVLQTISEMVENSVLIPSQN